MAIFSVNEIQTFYLLFSIYLSLCAKLMLKNLINKSICRFTTKKIGDWGRPGETLIRVASLNEVDTVTKFKNVKKL